MWCRPVCCPPFYGLPRSAARRRGLLDQRAGVALRADVAIRREVALAVVGDGHVHVVALLPPETVGGDDAVANIGPGADAAVVGPPDVDREVVGDLAVVRGHHHAETPRAVELPDEDGLAFERVGLLRQRRLARVGSAALARRGEDLGLLGLGAARDAEGDENGEARRGEETHHDGNLPCLVSRGGVYRYAN